MPTAGVPLLVLYATAGGPSVQSATDAAPDASVSPLRSNAPRLLTPCIRGWPGWVMFAVLKEQLVMLVELNGLYPPVTHLPPRSHGPRLSQAKVLTTTMPPASW